LKRYAAAVVVGIVATVAMVPACGPKDTATTQAECEKSKPCKEHGRCTWEMSHGKCIVGSDKDCAESTACKKDLLCKKVGDVCGKEE
jgi:hypothetical protein